MKRTAAQVIAESTPEARMRRERDEARARIKVLEDERERLIDRLGLLERFATKADREIPPWTRVKRPTGLHNATPALNLSDLHFDEVVSPDEVEGLNAYNREIALLRIHRLFDNATSFARRHLSGLKYDGFLLGLAGDIFSGIIHEELRETNEDTLFGSLLYWSEKLAGLIGGLADEFGHLHAVCVPGNHGRQTRKPRAKFYARDNMDWLLYHLLAREFRKDGRITWNIPDSRDATAIVYGTRIRWTHGDEARGGSGIAGKRTPLALLEHRKTRRVMQARQEPFDILMYGHWHEYDPGERLLGNGSLKGIDEYALGGEFGYEEPKQAFFLVTPEHGCSLKAPIYCMDRKREKW